MRPDNQSPSSLLPAGSAGEHLPLAVLRQYVAGTLPAAEQYRVERHTQACPRCADVLEGLSQTDLATTDQAVSGLQARLRARVAELEPDTAGPAVVPMWPWRQLAAVVLLLLVGTGVWLGLRRSSEGPAAASSGALRQPASAPESYATVPPAATPPAPETEAAETSAAVATTISAPAVALNTKPLKTRRLAKAAPPKAGAAPELSDAVAMSSAPAPTTASMETVQGASAETESMTADKADVAAKEGARQAVADSAQTYAKSRAATARMQAAAAPSAISKMAKARTIDANALRAETRTVQGRVTDSKGANGLGGVRIRANGVDTGVTTAPDGSFVVTVSASTTTLAFDHAGYASRELPVPTDSGAVVLALTPQPTETPVLVRREKAPAPMDLAATPAGGQQAFRNYLRDNLEYPEKALKDEKEGSVKLSFVVNTDGALQDIKVVKGLTEECDAEAIRLLKEGPAWHPAVVNGRRTARTVQISVPFRIADQQ
ncbi:TonB family protein [Hymenobacter psychrotolerans]|uniref:TonB family C-terminal domain-containing protein n=1 Tax=Hymenobacter psychrotolerans DSM 18569 TaxID=1121959 RepID=A0A1M7C7E9_9BACT|nr:TonB family protein [Hymenobacter psychrotolerans]SHL63155.1 TonB family C-terminal domain-containing protein [Hymenobacter psychrotolerans DSM 18569]